MVWSCGKTLEPNSPTPHSPCSLHRQICRGWSEAVEHSQRQTLTLPLNHSELPTSSCMNCQFSLFFAACICLPRLCSFSRQSGPVWFAGGGGSAAGVCSHPGRSQQMAQRLSGGGGEFARRPPLQEAVRSGRSSTTTTTMTRCDLVFSFRRCAPSSKSPSRRCSTTSPPWCLS